MLFLDLDRFKLVNDSLGHHVGDRLLVAVARRLESALRPGDTVARLGGDEFTILLDDVCDAREATVIAERIQETLQEPFHLDGRELVVAASIGIALADPDAAPADVMRDADVAMYRAKAEGKGRHAVFDARMHELVMRRLDLETDLRRAIEADQIDVVYQPIVQAATGRIVGFEALARWHGPDGAPIDPADFVPIAEETGLIVALGRRVLERACAQLAEWRGAAGRRGRSRSASTSRTASSRSRTSRSSWPRCCETTGLDPRALRLEVREHDLARDAEATRRTLAHVLETLGVRWQIDDFGTGASSLRLLHRFPGDAVKIFGPLVSGMGHDGGSFEIVKAIVELAHNLGLEVIAEGVETAGQLEHLRVLGCEFAQGFHVSAPLAARGRARPARAGHAGPSAAATRGASRACPAGWSSRAKRLVAALLLVADLAALLELVRCPRRCRREPRATSRRRCGGVASRVGGIAASPTCRRTCRARARRSARGRRRRARAWSRAPGAARPPRAGARPPSGPSWPCARPSRPRARGSWRPRGARSATASRRCPSSRSRFLSSACSRMRGRKNEQGDAG